MEKAVNQPTNSDNYRYERKFIIKEFSLPEIKNMVNLNPACFAYHYPSRVINNIYFDSQNYDSVIDNIEGVANRLKTRIRWYGDCFSKNIDSVLEYKIKNGFAGRKEHYRLDKFSLNNDFTSNYIETILENSKLPDSINLRMSFLLPVILNSYTREYFISHDRKFRLTLDYALNYYQLEKHFNTYRVLSTDRQSVIMELKYNVEDDGLAKDLTNYFPFRVTKSSKYISGVLHKFMQ